MEKKLGYLEKLRAKPLGYRRTFALVVSVGFTSLVFLFWLVAKVSDFSSNEENIKASAGEEVSVFATIREQFAGVMDVNPIVDNLKRIDFGLDPNSTTTEPSFVATTTYTATTTNEGQATTSSNILVQ